MKINQIDIDDRTEKALKLTADFDAVTKRVKEFVGEAATTYDDRYGISACRKIASEGIISATQEAMQEGGA